MSDSNRIQIEGLLAHLPKPLVFSIMQDIKQFHEKFGLSWSGGPRELDPALQRFRMRFIIEEHTEFHSACLDEFTSRNKTAEREGRAKQLDAIVDLIYVLVGYAYLRGWNFDEAWRRVHAANMLKRRASPSEGRSQWDVVKPEGWKSPDLTDLV